MPITPTMDLRPFLPAEWGLPTQDQAVSETRCLTAGHVNPGDPEYVGLSWDDEAGWGPDFDVCPCCEGALRR